MVLAEYYSYKTAEPFDLPTQIAINLRVCVHVCVRECVRARVGVLCTILSHEINHGWPWFISTKNATDSNHKMQFTVCLYSRT